MGYFKNFKIAAGLTNIVDWWLNPIDSTKLMLPIKATATLECKIDRRLPSQVNQTYEICDLKEQRKNTLYKSLTITRHMRTPVEDTHTCNVLGVRNFQMNFFLQTTTTSVWPPQEECREECGIIWMGEPFGTLYIG